MLTNDQKNQRIGRITSSIAAAALGLDDNKTPIQAWRDIKGLLPDVTNKATDRGNRLEDIVLDYPADNHGFLRSRPAFVPHPTIPFFGDSADAYYLDKVTKQLVALGEGKTAALGMAKKWGDEGTDDVPLATLIQSQWHLIHHRPVDVCYVPLLVGGYKFEFAEYVVRYSGDLDSSLTEDLSRWYRDYVVTDKEPPATAKDTDYLTERYRIAADKTLPDSPEIEALARAKVAAAAKLKAAELEEETVKNRLRQILGDKQGVIAQWGKVTWTNNKEYAATDMDAVLASVCTEFSVPSAQLERLKKLHTTTKPGARVLRVTVKDKKVG